MKKINIGKLAINVAIPLIVGALASLLTMGSFELYQSIQKPNISPPSWVFGVVWTILYVLMGISSYLISQSSSIKREGALRIYAIQLVFNFIWPLLFFGAEAYLPSFILICILWITVLIMIISFYKINPVAAYLQIPYLLWLTFAGWLNLMVYMLNK